MKLNLELNTLKSVMRDFYAVTKVRSSTYDGNYQKILSYPDAHTPICSIMHGRADTLAHCKYSNLRAFKQCEKEKGTIVYTCHLGLSEVVAPLWDNNIIIGYIMFGQLTCSPPPGNLLENIRENVINIIYKLITLKRLFRRFRTAIMKSYIPWQD